jgi:hypothetical protein
MQHHDLYRPRRPWVQRGELSCPQILLDDRSYSICGPRRYKNAVMAGLPRSSNIAEGWHNVFRSMMGCINPQERAESDWLEDSTETDETTSSSWTEEVAGLFSEFEHYHRQLRRIRLIGLFEVCWNNDFECLNDVYYITILIPTVEWLHLWYS